MDLLGSDQAHKKHISQFFFAYKQLALSNNQQHIKQIYNSEYADKTNFNTPFLEYLYLNNDILILT